METPDVGTIIHGTHRAEDLIPAFHATLEQFDPNAAREILREWHGAIMSVGGDPSGGFTPDNVARLVEFDGENHAYLFEELEAALWDVTPDHLHFGAHPGDGADFGFWPVEWWDPDPLDNLEEG